MTRIDFYVISRAEDAGPVPLGCHLCEKAVKAGHTVYVYAPDGGLLEDFDSALWTFRQNSFVAHEYAEQCADTDITPVLLGRREPPDSHRQVLLSLAAEVPPFFSRFERVLEIVCGSPAEHARARERYRFYKQRGYEPSTHKL